MTMTDALDGAKAAAYDLWPQSVLDLLPALVFVVEENGLCTFVNGSFARYSGVGAARLLGAGWRQLLRPEDGEPLAGAWRGGAGSFEAECRFRHHDGEYRWHLLRSQPLKHEKKAAWLVTCFDIDDRRRDEQERALLASIVDETQDAIVSKSLDGMIRSWNPGAARLFGYTAAEAIGQPITLIIPPERLSEERMILRRLRAGERIEHFETVRLTRSGQRIDVSLTVSPILDESGTVISASKVARDISRQKRAEETLREREQRYALVLTGAGAAIWDWDVPAKTVVYSRRWKELLGLSDEEVSDSEDEWRKHIHPDDLERVVTSLQAHLEGRTRVYDEEYRVRHKDGTWLWVADRGIASRDSRGRVLRMAGSKTDITRTKEAMRALRLSETKLRALIELSPVGIGTIDAQGNTVSLNPSALAIHGFSSLREMLSRLEDYRAQFRLTYPDGTAIPPDEWPLARALRGDAVSDYEVILHRPDGERRTIMYSAVPLPHTPDEAAAMVFVMHDVTGLRAAEAERTRSESEYRELVQSANSAIIRWDREGTIAFANPYAESLFGYGPGELKDKHVNTLVPEESSTRREPASVFREIVAHPEKYADHVNENVTASGDRIWMLWTNHPAYNDAGDVAEILAVGSDITRLKMAEEALRDADQRKDEFLAVLGHELRNPLAPLKSGAELLQYANEKPELLEQVSGMMTRQVRHLLRLVDDLIDLSRVNQGRIELRRAPLDLNDAVGAAIERIKPLIDERRHELRVRGSEVAVPVEGDFERLSQVAANLLSNAAKYTAPGGTITVSTEIDEHQARLSVADNGLGIPHGSIGEIFKMFNRISENRGTASDSGLGIGLALSRRLIEQHGGSIEATSAGRGCGSEFVVSLPLAHPDILVGDRAPAARASGASERILIVDDNADAAESLRLILGIKGYRVRSVHDGQSALDVMPEFKPDVVLLDIGLPQMDGYETIAKLRQLPGGKRPLVFALTGWGQAQDEENSYKAGFDLHLTKPVDADVLADLIATRLRQP